MAPKEQKGAGVFFPIQERNMDQEYYAPVTEQSIVPPDERPAHHKEMERMSSFLSDYGEAAKKEGLVWGGKFSKASAKKAGVPGRYEQWKAVGVPGWDPMHTQAYRAGQYKKMGPATPEQVAGYQKKQGRVMDDLRSRGWDPVVTSGKRASSKTAKKSQHIENLAADVGERSFPGDKGGRKYRSTTVLDRFTRLEKESRAQIKQDRALVQEALPQLVEGWIDGSTVGRAASGEPPGRPVK